MLQVGTLDHALTRPTSVRPFGWRTVAMVVFGATAGLILAWWMLLGWLVCAGAGWVWHLMF